MVEFSRGEELYQFHWVVGTKDAKIPLKFWVGSLGLTVSLRVVGCGQADAILEETSELLGKGRGKLRATIRDEGIM